MRKRVADIIVDTLLKNDINDCFSVVGGGAMYLNNAFEINDAMNVYYCHHEQACAFAAEGYAKESGKIAAVCVTSGPGGVNTLNGIYSAYVDSTPIVVIAGHPRYETTVEACGLDIRCRGVQEFDIVSTVRKMTKYAVLVKDPSDIRYQLEKAIHVAQSGRKGPVWISIPLDVQSASVEENELKEYECTTNNGDICLEEIDQVFKMLANAKKPVILTGHGIRYSNSFDKFISFIKHVRIPVVGGALLPDILPEDYDMYFGPSGNIGPRAGNYILQNADLILILGNSLSVRQTGYNLDGFSPDSKKIMIDVSPDEMEKPGLNIDLKINMELNCFFDGVLNENHHSVNCSLDWSEFCRELSGFFKNFDEPEIPEDNSVPAKYFWKVFREKLKYDDVIALGNSNCVVGIYQYGIKKMGQRVITNINAGSMGYDLPEAYGCAISSGKRVICVTGDGSVMMNLQELQTIKYSKLPIKLVVFSNNGYGAIRQTCNNYFDGIYTGCDPDSGISFPDFKDVAQTFGFKYVKCPSTDVIEKKIDEFLEGNNQAILEINQPYVDVVLPRIVAKLNEDGTFRKPEYIDFSPVLNNEQETIIEELKKKYGV